VLRVERVENGKAHFRRLDPAGKDGPQAKDFVFPMAFEGDDKYRQAKAADPITTVAEGLAPLLADKDHGRKKAGCDALAKWGTLESGALLLPLVDSNDPWGGEVVKAAMLALASLKDPRGVAGIAKKLDDHRTAAAAAEALVRYGPMAEDAVLERVRTGVHQINASRAAIKILQDIGTEKSLKRLKDLQEDFFLKDQIAPAIKAIEPRVKM
jgi:HEAT repeat protein